MISTSRERTKELQTRAEIYKRNEDLPLWGGYGKIVPCFEEIEYRHRFTADDTIWAKTRVQYISAENVIFLNDKGEEEVHNVREIMFRPVGGLTVSPYADYLEGVVGVVEASSFERYTLWNTFHNIENGLSWGSENSGPMIKVGEITDGHPVYCSFMIITVNKKRLLFMEATSQSVDWKIIDDWLEKNLPKTAFKDSGYVNKVDASNFGNLVR